jgi:hypothetical protein
MNNLNLKKAMKEQRTPNFKKRSWKFWLGFWSLAIIFLFAWFIFLEQRKSGWLGIGNALIPVLKVVPIEDRQKTEIQSVFKIAEILKNKKELQTYLILFQNNMELRPGGGYIGAFGILKLKEGRVTEIGVHDTNVFDSRMNSEIKPPYPMEQTLNISNWELRDSNWSPDFAVNAEKAIELYKVQGGAEKLDGVVAISTELLMSFLEFTGPISIEGFPGEYNHENAIEKLEYQVELGYKEQDIEKGKRKYIMKYLAKEILEKAQNLNLNEKRKLLLRLENHLNQKDVMLNFHDSKIQQEIVDLNWDGDVIENPTMDYLMMVDANLGAYKTDAKMKRYFSYRIDFSAEKPTAELKITYINTAKNRDWLTSDYQSYLRVYTPNGSWLIDSNNYHPMKFGEEFGKKYFGTLVQAPIGQTKVYNFKYLLADEVKAEDYHLTIQKQSGIDKIQGTIEIINKDGSLYKYDVSNEEDWFSK